MIREIEKIPEKEKTLHEKVADDIKYALAHGISAFEFDGYENYGAIPDYARKAGTNIANREIRKRFKDLKDIDDIPVRYRSLYFTDVRDLFTVRTSKSSGENDHLHVYMDISGMTDENFMKLAKHEYEKALKRDGFNN